MHIIFDLDGTISDSSRGVIQSLKALFEEYNLPRLSDEELKKYIGPPIEQTLGKYLPSEEISEAVELYRKFYKEEGGIDKNTMYKGMDKLLKRLKQKNNNIYLATTKEVGMAKEILKTFGIDSFFNGIYGADPSREIYTKTDVLKELFSHHKIDKENCLLIGDTVYDVNGARDVGIKVGIVLYGYGKKKDFEGKDIEFFVDTVEDLYQAVDI
ncbi:MAG: HAD-IA family hydrolase [Bacillota bacterium]